MAMFICVGVLALVLLVRFATKARWGLALGAVLASFIFTPLFVFIDYSSQTTATEVWSGRVIGWEHNEEWDEWHQPVTSCSNNNVCSTTPGYWEHHDATNYIKTTDNGRVQVHVSPDGRKLNDKWPNTTEELKVLWPYNTPTASTHTYENKVQASYSIFKHDDIDLDKFPNLPDYPEAMRDYIYVDRILGDVRDKDKALTVLAEVNSELNRPVPNPEKPGKTMSWKQVNIIFVNVGTNTDPSYGFALQDKWEGGNKNDFVIAFSTNEDNKAIWSYPFSWSEVELLKLDVRDYMLNQNNLNDFTAVVHDVGDLVADKFVRKQFADFNYLQIDTSKGAWIFIWIVNSLIFIITAGRMLKEHGETKWFKY
ncbi:hypothetical protein [Paenibacillus sp. 1781tsa1]|uniref:hypothetical protein n=1 Tax=Paenibacillus sp. 1781tsa1 TaxID=2953810 RepID=UPI0020A1D128|nr:hypothetical protein [Paenibacillus sp. 1781tsa1]MCP1184938.1 hypothetical protein [Paenibacillus sp. 1781tsa1]